MLVVRLHPEILRSQGLPEELRDEKTIWEGAHPFAWLYPVSRLTMVGTRTGPEMFRLSSLLVPPRERQLERVVGMSVFPVMDKYRGDSWRFS